MSPSGIRPRPGSRSEAVVPPSASPAPLVPVTEVCCAPFLPLLNEVTQVAARSHDLSALLRLLLQRMQQQVGVVRAQIYLREPTTGHTLFREHAGLCAETLSRGGWHPEQGLIGKTLETGVSFILPDIRQAPEVVAELGHAEAELPALSFLCLPILRNAQVLGTLSAECRYDSPQALRTARILLETLAAILSQPVELYRLESLRRRTLEEENRRLRSALLGRFKPASLIGSSKPMRAVYRMLEKVTRSRTSVLILGESGVGKELVASAIHYNGPWAKGPFVSVNCAALPEGQIDSELFGHEYRAFSGSPTSRRGRFEQADGGTLFLDEISELSLPMQSKLLRVIQEKSFERVGSNVTVQVDLRLLVATSRNLKQRVAEGLFRDDLYYRLNVFPISLPPLRERGTDILVLAEHFIERLSLALNLPSAGLSAEARYLLLCYHWPGNVRELEYVIERALQLAQGHLIQAEHLPPSLQAPALPDMGIPGMLDARIANAERNIIIEALTQTQGNTTEAAVLLGLTRRMLGLRMAKHQLSYKDYRP